METNTTRKSSISTNRDSMGSDMGYFSTSPGQDLPATPHTSLLDFYKSNSNTQLQLINEDGYHTARSSLYLTPSSVYSNLSFSDLPIFVNEDGGNGGILNGFNEEEYKLESTYHTPKMSFLDMKNGKESKKNTPILKEEKEVFLECEERTSSPTTIEEEEKIDLVKEQMEELQLSLMNDESNLQRRLNIAMEILNTERTYLAGLELIETTFYKPLLEASQSNNPIIESKRIADIFSNLMGILAVNREFLSQLETRLVKNEWCPKNGLIGDIFCQLAPYFRMYSLYVKNFNSALAVISEQMGKSVAFATFLKDKKIVEQCKGLPFESYLILPVQRIPRYKLLIEDLIKRTHSSHVDYDNLVKGLDIVSKAATFVNETIRQHEMFMDMLLIQKSLQGFNENLLIPGRKLIKKGSVYKICRKNHQLRVFFLFSDILIYGSGNPDSDSTLVFHRKVDLEVVKIVDVPDTDNIKNLFQIISQEKSFAAYCDTIKEKQSWLDAFNTTIKELHSNKKTLKLDTNSIRQKKEIILPLVVKDYSAPVWIPDDQAIDCHCCKEEFTVFKRKHHCRLCGNVVCHTCSNNTFFIPGQSLVDHRPARACDKCYKLKFKGENPPPHTSLSALKRYSFLGTGSTSSTSTSNSDLSTSSPIFPPARFPFNAPKRLVELRETINNSRDSYFSDSSSLLSFWTDEDTKNKNNKSNEFNNNNSTNSSLSRLSRLRSMSGSTAALIGGFTSNTRSCELCLIEFNVFKWKNECQTCKKIVCGDCLSKKPIIKAKRQSMVNLQKEIHKSQHHEDSSSIISNNNSNNSTLIDDVVLCDPCYLGVDPNHVVVNPEGGGWGVHEVTSLTSPPKQKEKELNERIKMETSNPLVSEPEDFKLSG